MAHLFMSAICPQPKPVTLLRKYQLMKCYPLCFPCASNALVVASKTEVKESCSFLGRSDNS